jgi:hypothetical protein
MSKDKFVFTNLNPHLAFIKLIWNIFGILNQLPDPSYPGILVFRQVVDMLSKFLCDGDKPSLVL